MIQKPDFQNMSRKELRKYVLSHREDNEALRIYMERLRTETGVIRHTGGLNQEDINQLEQFLKTRVNHTEIKPMSETYQSKYDQRNAQIGGIVDTAQTGSHPEFHQHNYPSQNLTEAAAEIQHLLQQLQQSYPTNTTAEQMIVAAKAIEQIESNPTLKQRAINAVKEGGLAAFEKTLDNPIGALIVGTIKGWSEVKTD